MDSQNAPRSFIDGLELYTNITIRDNLAVDLDTKEAVSKDEINARCSALDEDILAAGIRIIDVP